MSIEEFFATARERHAIYERRFREKRPAPWTEDPIFQRHRFCNVYRELDTTTIWFRGNVRDPLRDRPEVLLATVVFRMFNRISTGEAIFSQKNLDGLTAFEVMLGYQSTMNGFDWVAEMRSAILACCGAGPYVTGSYIVQGKHGMPKLDGVLWVIENFARDDWREKARELLTNVYSLEQIWKWLKTFPYVGPFVAYELVSDLRHTALLDKAPDVMTWANPGPGCKRGLNLMFGKDRFDAKGRLDAMHGLLTMSTSGRFWPPRYPPWEMREVEHWLCEYAKYKRIQGGGPGTRQRFKGGG